MNHHRFGFPPNQAFEASIMGEEKNSQKIPRHHPPMPPPLSRPASNPLMRPNVDNSNFAHIFESKHFSNGDDRAWTAHEGHWNARHRQNTSTPNAHEQKVQKNKVCRLFYGGEACPFGDKCSYLHVEPASLQDSPGEYYAPRQISIYWKTKLCYRWSFSGHCPFGDQCSYAHGVAELRKPGEDHRMENVAAGVPLNVDTSLAIDVLANTNTEMSSLPEGRPKMRALTLEKSKRIYGDWIDDLKL